MDVSTSNGTTKRFTYRADNIVGDATISFSDFEPLAVSTGGD
jgi:hypothetical protein